MFRLRSPIIFNRIPIEIGQVSEAYMTRVDKTLLSVASALSYPFNISLDFMPLYWQEAFSYRRIIRKRRSVSVIIFLRRVPSLCPVNLCHPSVPLIPSTDSRYVFTRSNSVYRRSNDKKKKELLIETRFIKRLLPICDIFLSKIYSSINKQYLKKENSPIE